MPGNLIIITLNVLNTSKIKHLSVNSPNKQILNVIFVYHFTEYSLNMNSKEIFGINLRHFRKLNNLTQEELSEKLGVTAIHLGRIENGKSFVTAELLDSLCLIFNISPATFFYTTQEFSGDDSLFAKIDNIIDDELKHVGIKLKERIRK